MKLQLSPHHFTDELLESVNEWSLANCERKFLNCGGMLVIPGQFKIEEGDALYPVCSGGVCRSQTLYLLLKELLEKKNVRIFPPHASRRGLDPYNGEIQIHREIVMHDEFEKAFNLQRCLQFGFDQREKWLQSGLNVEEIKRYYDENYFGPIPAKRRVYIAFSSPVHVILKRLIETNEHLEGVAVVAIPLIDEISHPPSPEIASGSTEAYFAFLNKIRPFFQF